MAKGKSGGRRGELPPPAYIDYEVLAGLTDTELKAFTAGWPKLSPSASKTFKQRLEAARVIHRRAAAAQAAAAAEAARLRSLALADRFRAAAAAEAARLPSLALANRRCSLALAVDDQIPPPVVTNAHDTPPAVPEAGPEVPPAADAPAALYNDVPGFAVPDLGK